MKKYYLLFGIVTIGILLLGSVPVLVVAQVDPLSEGPMPGTYDVRFNVTLTNVWDTGEPTPSTPSGITNTNLRYNVTDMESPLDQFMNMGFFNPSGTDDPSIPEISLTGTLENSTLFVKITNDQGTQIDWQPSFILGNDLTVAWQLTEVPTEMPFPIDLIPDDFTIVKGSGIPAFPSISATTNFSDFFEYQDLVKDYGYDNLPFPFFMPGIIYLLDVNNAYEFWTNEVDLTAMFPDPVGPGEYLNVNANTANNPTNVTLELELEGGNSTSGTVFANVTAWFDWNKATGYLDEFSVELFGDLDQNGTLDAGERFYIEFAQISETQDNLPIDIGDSGQYNLDIDVQITLDLENDTFETAITSMLTSILDPINNELDGIHLLNYTIDSMDGLYYHINGYIFDLGKFFEDRFSTLFSDGTVNGIGAQANPIESYYTSIDQLSGGQGESTQSWAINLFDAAVYQNTTEWMQGNGYLYTNYLGWNGTHDVFNTSHLQLNYNMDMDGVEEVWIFNQTLWETSWNKNTTTFEEHFNNMLGSVIYNDVPVYVDNVAGGTDLWASGPNGTFTFEGYFGGENYYAVYLIKGMPGTSYTSYMPTTNIYMLPIMMTGGMGSQTGFSIDMSGISSVIPMPIRTPDWDVTGGMYVFLEGVMDQLEAVVEDPAFIEFIEAQQLDVTGITLGDALTINNVNLEFLWIDEFEGLGYVGSKSLENLDISAIENNTELKKTDYMHVQYGSQHEYTWETGGSLDRVMLYTSLYLNYTSVPWPEPLKTTTTTTTEPVLAPGFEAFLTIGTLVLLPIVYKKKRR